MQRVVDGDRTRGEAIESKPSIAPRLVAGPPQRLRHILLGAVAGGVEPPIAVARSADLNQQVVVGGAVVHRAAARAVGAELDDHRASAKRPLPGHCGLQAHAVGHRHAGVQGRRVRDGGRGEEQRGRQRSGCGHPPHGLPSNEHGCS